MLAQTQTIQRVLSYEDTRPRIRPDALSTDPPTHQISDTEPLTTFDCIDGIIGRIIPFQSLYVLDFVWADGTRVKDRPDFGVWDVAGSPVRISPIGKLEEHRDFSQYYYISHVRMYEIRRGNKVIKTLHFPRNLVVM